MKNKATENTEGTEKKRESGYQESRRWASGDQEIRMRSLTPLGIVSFGGLRAHPTFWLDTDLFDKPAQLTAGELGTG